MNKFFRWYYQNKNKFWVIVLVIIGSYGLLLLLNNNALNTGSYISTQPNYTNPNTIQSEYSVISNEYIDKSEIADANKIIDKFISYCNEKNFEAAYNLLSENCKDEKFPNLSTFIDNYCNEIFKTTKIYEMQNWKNKTYRIKLYDNPMETRNKRKWRICRRLFYNCRKKW